MARHVELLKGNILRSLTLLALPIMGSQLVQMAYNLTDMIWIGRVGAGAVAAVGAAGMFMWLSNGMAVLPRMGGQVKVAQSIGAGDIEAAGRYAAAALQMGGVMSLVYTVAMFVGAGPLIGFFRLNSAEGRPAAVDAELAAFIETALSYCREVDGLFDVTMGSATQLWNFKDCMIPARDDVAAALRHVDYRGVIVNDAVVTLR